MKQLHAFLIGFLLVALTMVPAFSATVTEGSNTTSMPYGPAQLDSDFQLKQRQGRRTTTVYPAGTTSSARGGDTVNTTSADYCATGANAIVCTGTDGKVSTAVLPSGSIVAGTNVVLSRRTGTGTNTATATVTSLANTDTGTVSATSDPVPVVCSFGMNCAGRTATGTDTGTATGTGTRYATKDSPVTINAATVTSLPVQDTRNVDNSPSDTSKWRSVSADFKRNSTNSCPGGGTIYNLQLTLSPFTDLSGGATKQICFGNGTPPDVYIRASVDATTWGPWNSIAIPSATTGAAPALFAVPSRDTRAVTDAPQDWPAEVKWDFKTKSTVGLSGASGSYVGVMTWRKYSTGADFSGGQVVQIAYDDAGTLWTRVSTSATTWGAWSTVAGVPATATISTTPPLALSSGGTITEIVTNTDTGTNTGTGTVSGSATATATNTATATASATRSGSDTFTRTNTFTTTGTYTFSGTGNGVDAFSVTLTTTTTGTVTGTATVTMTGTATATAGSGTGTVTSTVSATSTATSSATATQTVMSPGTADRYTITRAKTATSTGTVTLTEYVTISLTGTNTASGSGTVTATVTGTATATATGTASGTWSGTSTSTATQTTTGTSTNAATGRVADGLTISSNPTAKAISPFTIDGDTSDWTCGQMQNIGTWAGCARGAGPLMQEDAVFSFGATTGIVGNASMSSGLMIKAGETELTLTPTRVTAGSRPLEGSNLTEYGHALIDLQKPTAPCGPGQALTSTEGTDTYCIDVGGAGSLARPTSVCAPGYVLTSYTEGVSTCVSNGAGSGVSCASGGSCTSYRLPMFTNSSSVANSPLTASGSDVYVDRYISASNIDSAGNTTGRAAGDCHSDGTNCPTAATLGALPNTTPHVASTWSSVRTNDVSTQNTWADAVPAMAVAVPAAGSPPMGCRLICWGSVSGLIGQTEYAGTAMARLLIATTNVASAQSRSAVSVPAQVGGTMYVSMAPSATYDDPYCTLAGTVYVYLKYAMSNSDHFYISPASDANQSATLTCEVFRY